jgi:hypothetical protein
VTQRPVEPRSWRTAILFAVTALIACLLLGGAFVVASLSAAGMEEVGNGDELASGTPVAAEAEAQDPLDSDPSQGTPIAGDPLDGDPLDGPVADGDPNSPVDQTQLEIVRSARPPDEPATVVAYDDDPQTVWMPQADEDESWLWLDLGLERRLREVRWLAQGTGSVEIAVSSDRERWRDVGRVEVGRGWQGVELRDDARYVRLALLPTNDGGELPAIAEAAVYGSDRRPNTSLEQSAVDSRQRVRGRKSRGNMQSVSEQKAKSNDSPSGDEGQKESRSGGRLRISAEPGETRCSGDRERCEARQGEVSVEDDCEREGTCTIDIRADGGTAVCDASGGDETKAGEGEGRRGGKGGRCEAVANGGAVAIADVKP